MVAQDRALDSELRCLGAMGLSRLNDVGNATRVLTELLNDSTTPPKVAAAAAKTLGERGLYPMDAARDAVQLLWRCVHQDERPSVVRVAAANALGMGGHGFCAKWDSIASGRARPRQDDPRRLQPAAGPQQARSRPSLRRAPRIRTQTVPTRHPVTLGDTRRYAGSLEMELAGPEPATSWVRCDWSGAAVDVKGADLQGCLRGRRRTLSAAWSPDWGRLSAIWALHEASAQTHRASATSMSLHRGMCM
jgi:hypothetical protein